MNEINIIYIFLAALALSAVLAIFKAPLRIIKTAIMNSLIGIIGLWVYNTWVAGAIGLAVIPITIVNALVVGMFGIVGLLMLILYPIIFA